MAKDNFKKAAKPQSGELIEACKEHDIVKVKSLLARGADINEKDHGDNTALIWASYKGHTGIAQILIKAGAKLDEKDNTGNTALILASGWGRPAIVQILIKAGAKLDEKDEDGDTALIRAVIGRYTDIAQMLIDAGAKLDKKNGEGKTALAYAQVRQYDDIVTIFEQAVKDRAEQAEMRRQKIMQQIADPSLQRPLKVKPIVKF